MTATVYIATSLDGFIAREDGALDWLPQPGSAASDDADDYGYKAFIASIDAIVMGRHTYEKVLTFDAWPYDKPVVVLTSRPILMPAQHGVLVVAASGPPAEVLAALADRGMGRVYIDGGVTIQRFLDADAIDRLIITRVPVLIGRGIPLFGPLSRDIPLRHVQTRAFASGLVQSEYVRLA